MSALRELQMALGDAVVHGGSIPEIRDSGPGRSALLAIYRNNFYTNLTEALRSTYPVVDRLVGTGFFGHCAHQYIRRYSSTTGNLHDFGSSFAQFLSNFPPAAQLPYLPDVARLEWAWHEVFHAQASECTLDLYKLQSVPDTLHGDICFKLNTAARLVESVYPIMHIWQVNQPDHEGDDHVDLAEGNSRILLIQRQATVELYSLGPGEWALLQSFAEALNLRTAYAAAIEKDSDFDLTSVLQHHFLLGTLTSCAIRGDY